MVNYDKLNFSELNYPKIMPKMAAYVAFLGVVLSFVKRVIDFIIKAK